MCLYLIGLTNLSDLTDSSDLTNSTGGIGWLGLLIVKLFVLISIISYSLFNDSILLFSGKKFEKSFVINSMISNKLLE